jgi:AAA+ superfamily predicted ATPase
MAGKFEILKITKLSDIDENTVLPKSDLAVQTKDSLAQFKYIGEEEKIKLKIIKPGIWSLKSGLGGIEQVAVDLGKKRLLLDIVGSQSILDEADRFFNSLHIYEQLERQKKRGVLLYSSPGMGKSSTIAHFCNESFKKDPGTVVLVWPTSKVEPDDVCDYLATETKLHKKCTKMILILEDIGGAEYENGGRARGVSSGILNLLDGVAVAFKLPTFIIATTNHPENLMASLADRPGRFDLKIELKPPVLAERIRIMEFIAKRDLTDEEKKAISTKDCDSFSIAHLEETIVRSLLHRKSLVQTIKEVVDERKFAEKAFEKSKKLGFGGSSDLD